MRTVLASGKPLAPGGSGASKVFCLLGAQVLTTELMGIAVSIYPRIGTLDAVVEPKTPERSCVTKDMHLFS
jgi:hypothetical protein